MPWSRRFQLPIPLPGRGPIETLLQAAEYIQDLPEAEQSKAHWQLAVEALILVAQEKDGPTMFARIAMMRALNYGAPREFVKRKKAAKQYRIIR